MTMAAALDLPVIDLFGLMPDGAPVERIRLRGADGFEVSVLTLGAIIQALHVPDRRGETADIVLGHDTLEPYLRHRRYFGAAVGRYANRIRGGTFSLDRRDCRVPANDGLNALHGGPDGFDRRLWKIEATEGGATPSVTLGLASPDGDQGFPGELRAQITYRVSGTELSIAFAATTTQPTVVNLTHHGFFNLAGIERSSDVLDHVLTLDAEAYLPVDATAIPLGGPAAVAGTPFDFRTPVAIGARIREGHEQVRLGRGYDHNYCLPGGPSATPRRAARVEHPGSGRVMELLTDQPGLQFYSGNFLDGTAEGKFGRLYRQSDAFCLEPQAWPDSPNRPDFPSARLDPGETYRHLSLYRFSTL
ncbi:galactose mutarotase [Ancylobacter sp. A5.8]|uniref:aldose epimerase family protein n=1 Tax=Ancylobacter gelatini TaxID=2919920 RepID=UPI001F4DB8E2|nr:aldose epimerase family protein [Ancylobacter gelatini]MCJ8145208.1 galactose mutarotase [Ancylobacter gelatini]